MSKNAIANASTILLGLSLALIGYSVIQLFGPFALGLIVGVLVALVALGGISYAMRD